MEQWFINHGEWLFFAFLLLCFGFLLLQQYRNNKAPEYTASVTVASHQTEPARFSPRWTSGWNYYVTFRLNDGDTVTLYTTEQDFLSLKDGQAVTILWQNKNLLHYE